VDHPQVAQQYALVFEAVRERWHGSRHAAAHVSVVTAAGSEEEGVFVVREGRAYFVPVETGIAGEKVFIEFDSLVNFSLLLDITAEQPELAGPWINLGQVYVALDQPEEARRAFETATVANPWNCTAHNELGLLSRQNGDFEAAERHYLRCIENAPGHGPAYLNLGILYELYLGRLSDALSYYRTYQTLLGEPDRRVQGWVMDLERRLGV